MRPVLFVSFEPPAAAVAMQYLLKRMINQCFLYSVTVKVMIHKVGPFESFLTHAASVNCFFK